LETVKVLLCPGVMEAGLKAHPAGASRLEHTRLIAPVKPKGVVADTLNGTVSPPLITVPELPAAAKEKATTPAPEREIDWGLPLASSVTVSTPLLEPVPVGVKLTRMVQGLPTGTLLPQLFN